MADADVDTELAATEAIIAAAMQHHNSIVGNLLNRPIDTISHLLTAMQTMISVIQGFETRINAVEDHVADLETRVVKLESGGGSSSGGSGDGSTPTGSSG